MCTHISPFKRVLLLVLYGHDSTDPSCLGTVQLRFHQLAVDASGVNVVKQDSVIPPQCSSAAMDSDCLIPASLAVAIIIKKKRPSNIGTRKKYSV